jgi:hypothetical protein
MLDIFAVIIMTTTSVEIVSDVISAKPLHDSRIKPSKKTEIAIKKCAFIKDMECRLPVCDMKVCEKCPEGHVYCTRIAFIKSLISKVLLLFICFFLFFDI